MSSGSTIPVRHCSVQRHTFLLGFLSLLTCFVLTPAPVLATAPTPADAWAVSEASLQESGPERLTGFDRLPAGTAYRIEPATGLFTSGQRVNLPIPGGDAVTLNLSTAASHANGDISLHGRPTSRDGGQGHAHLTIGRDGIFGRIGTAGGQYLVHTDASGSWLIHLDDPRLSVDHGCHGPVGDPSVGLSPRQAVNRGDSGLQQIDILMLYSPDMAQRYPGGLLQTRLNHLFAVANQATVDSDVELVFRMVHFEQVDEPSSPDIFDALSNMRDGLRGETADVFTDLDQLRDQHGADLVVFTWPHDIETRGACGVAFLPQVDPDSGTYDPSLGVHVTNDGISNWSICSDAVFTHELGHNLGVLHQRNTHGDPQEGHNFAHVVPDRYNTVMSSFGSADINRYMRIPVFSNPDIQCGGVSCGSMTPGEEANAAQTLRDLAPEVASYSEPVYPGMLTPPMPSIPDSDGDGINDWEDPYPFDPFNGVPPVVPEPPEFVAPPLFDGTEIDHFELLIASSGNDQVHAYSMQGQWRGMAIQAETNPFPDERPALSEFTRMEVRADGMVYMLSSAAVRRFDRISQSESDIFLNSQPPFSSPGSLVDGFPRSMRFAPGQNELMVLGNGNIQVYDAGGSLLAFLNLPSAVDPTTTQWPVQLRDVAFDSAGNHYIVDRAERRIVIFDGYAFGDYAGELVVPGSQQLVDPWSIVIGPDGHLYVANGSANNILRVDIDNGAISTFVAEGSGALDFARDLTFGPDGHLYVLSRASNAVLRYDGTSGSFMNAFVAPGTAGLNDPESMQFTLRMNLDIFRDRFE